MKRIKSMIVAATIFCMAAGTFDSNLDAQEYCTYTGGCGYEDSISTPSLTPYIVLATALLGTIVAVAVRHKGHHQGHAHSH
jgi:hypothetical protein